MEDNGSADYILWHKVYCILAAATAAQCITMAHSFHVNCSRTSKATKRCITRVLYEQNCCTRNLALLLMLSRPQKVRRQLQCRDFNKAPITATKSATDKPCRIRQLWTSAIGSQISGFCDRSCVILLSAGDTD